MERKESKLPFVGLHAHSVASVFDGLGYPPIVTAWML